jgi:hypothetical protein
MLWNGLAQGTRTVYTTAVKAYVLLCRLRLSGYLGIFNVLLLLNRRYLINQ